MSESYQEYRKQVKSEQSGKDYEEIKEEMEKQSDFMVELDNLGTQPHRWVDRGAVMSCEGAGHANHRAFKIRK